MQYTLSNSIGRIMFIMNTLGKYNWGNRKGGDKIIYVIREAQREEYKMVLEVFY